MHDMEEHWMCVHVSMQQQRLQDPNHCRKAIERDDIRDREEWTSVSRTQYTKTSDKKESSLKKEKIVQRNARKCAREDCATTVRTRRSAESILHPGADAPGRGGAFWTLTRSGVGQNRRAAGPQKGVGPVGVR